MTNDQVLIFYWELFIYHMKHLIISMKIYLGILQMILIR